MTSRPSIGLITHVIQSAVTLKAFPKHFDAARVSEGELLLNSQGSIAQLKQISKAKLISTTVTSNLIIFNKTSTSKSQLVISKTFCMRAIKPYWFVISEDAEI